MAETSTVSESRNPVRWLVIKYSPIPSDCTRIRASLTVSEGSIHTCCPRSTTRKMSTGGIMHKLIAETLGVVCALVYSSWWLKGSLKNSRPQSGKRTFWSKDWPVAANPSTVVWVSDLKDDTTFRTEREAWAVKRQVKDALAVTKGMDGFFYVAG